MDINRVNNLIDPNSHQEPVKIHDVTKDQLISMYRKMVLIRKAEEKISENVENGIIKCPCHLAIGQEAIGVAVSMIMKNTDNAFGAHRSHSHYLALNEDTYSLFAEVLGKSDGCSNGMGGSMHIVDNEVGFRGSVPIVGATIPIATGAAISSKLKNNKSIAISYFGDGACEEGVFHESLNMASIMNLPVLYVCENNLFSSHLHISKRQPLSSTSRFAHAHNIDYEVVDGNNVVEIYNLLTKKIDIMRNQYKPFFIETITYRWKGHVGHRDDIDVGVKRNEDLSLWKKRDPINRLKISLINSEIYNENELKKINLEIDSKIQLDWEKALKADYPDKSFLTKPVYKYDHNN